MTKSSPIARRTFLKRMSHLGIAGSAAPWALNLAAMGEAAAFTGSGYKALVCVFLYGGNDNGNTVVPYDTTSYNSYATARGSTLTSSGGIVIPRSELAAAALSAANLPSGRQYALAPQLSPLAPYFETGKLAVQLNVGPLIQPTTLAQYQARNVALPPKLFSHNDQQSVWQSSYAEGSVKGWGGNLGDLALSSNGGNSLFTCMSVTGNAVFLAGDTALPYQIGTSGATAIGATSSASGAYGSEACKAALNTLLTESRTHVLENEFNRITRRSIDSQVTLNSAIGGNASKFDTQLPDTVGGRSSSINRQLKMVARLIDAQANLGLTRQVFLVSMGGFDTHDNLSTTHPALMAQLAGGLKGFYDAMVAAGKADMVTTFTASDFGRTMTSNGDGSDHGWGSHHFVMGGAVKGQKFYGAAPEAALGHSQDVGQGRLLPTTSVDQYAATLARWFGVSDAEMTQVAPNIGNYSTRNLGFLG